MKQINLRKTLSAAALMGATIMMTNAMADSPQGAHGPGYGMMGGYGMGPGMMGGYGSGYGMGSGMMGGYGSGYGMGSGMMGGYGSGYGMGPGMMGGCGSSYGMAPGMMRGYGPGSDLSLSSEQRRKIAKIRNDVRHKYWELMGKILDEESQMNEQYYAENRDDAALSKGYRKMSELRQQMFDLSLAAQKQMDAVLTKEQREKLGRH